MYWDMSVILLFVLFGLVFVLINIGLSRLLTWFFNIQRRDPRKHTSYECGENPVGDARVRFNSRFYLVALIFLLFDVEVIFVLPIAVIYKQYSLVAFLELGIFLLMLLVGLAYAWVNNDLDWVKPKPRFTRSDVTP